MLVLITNPGSASRKYALYSGDELVCTLHFEYEGEIIVCTLKRADGSEELKKQSYKNFNETVTHLPGILTEAGFLDENTRLSAILARIVAPGSYFAEDHLVDRECLDQLKIAKKRAPLHVPVVADEIGHLVKTFNDTPVIAVSDSKFHQSRPDTAMLYGIDPKVAAEADLKRFGFHGLSVSSVVRYMEAHEILPKRLIVCHLGSGSSVTAVLDGKSLDTSMGYTPLSGLVMATRCGDMDAAAVLRLKHYLGNGDEGLERYLNKECGLLGISGQTDDMREILRLREGGDARATLAYDMFVYKVQSQIGQMAAVLGGVDAIVFTATIGERSDQVRTSICENLRYLGFKINESKNVDQMSGRHTNLAAFGSKPIFIVRTDETNEMMRVFESFFIKK